MNVRTQTATAFITFGFGRCKRFEIVRFVTGRKPSEHRVRPRVFALGLASVGNFALSLAAIQHRQSLQSIRAPGLKVLYSAAGILAVLLSIAEIGVLVAIIPHL